MATEVRVLFDKNRDNDVRFRSFFISSRATRLIFQEMDKTRCNFQFRATYITQREIIKNTIVKFQRCYGFSKKKKELPTYKYIFSIDWSNGKIHGSKVSSRNSQRYTRAAEHIMKHDGILRV